MATLKQKHFTGLSLALLLISYIWFGWYLCSLKTPAWVTPVCFQLLAAPVQHWHERSDQSAEPTHKAEKTISPAESAPANATHSTDLKSPTIPEASKEESNTHLSAESMAGTQNFKGTLCKAVMNYNLPAGVLAIGWIVVSSLALISPLTNFSAFLTRWFTSDTVAFATIFLIAGLATVILYWMHIFLQITTILAVDTLARIDIQYAGLTGTQAFWILTLISFTGLVIGWTVNAVV